MSELQIVFGKHSVKSLLKHCPTLIKKIIIQKGSHEVSALIDEARTNNTPVLFQSKSELENLSQNKQHQGIIAFYQEREYTEDDLIDLLESNKPLSFLLLDCIQDPHNFGACIRTANAAGIDAIIYPKNKSCGITPVVRKVASGGINTTKIIPVTNLARTIDSLKQANIFVIGTSDQATNTLYQTDLTDNIAIVLGSEGTGMRKLIGQKCDELIQIPMSGTVESLNVSVATGICLFEMVRQRQG